MKKAVFTLLETMDDGEVVERLSSESHAAVASALLSMREAGCQVKIKLAKPGPGRKKKLAFASIYPSCVCLFCETIVAAGGSCDCGKTQDAP